MNDCKKFLTSYNHSYFFKGDVRNYINFIFINKSIMLYYDPLTKRYIYDDFSCYILTPFSIALYISSLKKVNRTERERILNNLKKFLFRRFDLRNPSTYTIWLFAQLIASRRQDGFPVPFNIALGIYFLRILEPSIPLLLNEINGLSRKIASGSSISLATKIGLYSNLLCNYAEKHIKPASVRIITTYISKMIITFIFKKILFLGVRNSSFLLNFGRLTWCAQSPFRRSILFVCSSLVGGAMGYYISPKKSAYLGTLSLSFGPLLNITKYGIIEHYKSILDNQVQQMLQNGYSWNQIVEYLALDHPEYYKYFKANFLPSSIQPRLFSPVSLDSLIKEKQKSSLKIMKNNINSQSNQLVEDISWKAETAIEIEIPLSVISSDSNTVAPIKEEWDAGTSGASPIQE